MRLCAPRRLAPFPSSFTSSSSRKRESRKSRLKSSPSSSSFKDDDGCGFLDDDDSDDDDSKVRCIALPDDDDDEKVDAFLSKTIIDSEEEDGPGTFALLTRMKKEDEWTRVHVQSTKALKRDILSATTMLKARRRTTTTTSDDTDEKNRSRFVVAYKLLPIGARKKMFKDAERYFEERFASSSSTTVAGRGEDDGSRDDGSRDDGDVKNRKSFDTPTTAQTLLFSSEHVEQLEAFGFVVLDDVVPEQAVR